MEFNIPLAERMRPKTLDEYIGQAHLVGTNAVLRKMIESGALSSFILWGPPGVGKTTLAHIISQSLNRSFYTLSAISSGVKEVREVIEKAKKSKFFNSPNPILFIDEIHRFSKSQQDSLLGAVEQGVFTLIGATTENPSFEIIPALLSRCQVYVLQSLGATELDMLLQRCLTEDTLLKRLSIDVREKKALFRYSGGDGRKLLNILELVLASQGTEGQKQLVIDDELVTKALQQTTAGYDKNGEMHYDVISAFIKSVRGSDPDAAVYWLARMIEGGEAARFIARRLLILAAEDIGLANPNALLLAQACFNAVDVIGFPESRIILSEATIYLASSPKSNSAYEAINQAQDLVKRTGDLPVPLHLRNAPTKLMKELGYGRDYLYPHAYDGNFTAQQYLPTEIVNERLYRPQKNAQENNILERLKAWWKNKFSGN